MKLGKTSGALVFLCVGYVVADVWAAVREGRLPAVLGWLGDVFRWLSARMPWADATATRLGVPTPLLVIGAVVGFFLAMSAVLGGRVKVGK